MDDKFASHHSDLRLLQRTHEFDKSLTELWEEGVECEVKYHSYDEARVIPSHNVVLLVENNTVITVLDNLHNVTVEGQNFQEYLGGAIE